MTPKTPPEAPIAPSSGSAQARAMRLILAFAALSGLVAVGIGAWSAHSAEAFLEPQALAWVKTGAQYQLWHSLALLAVGLLVAVKPGRFLRAAGIGFAAGILLFSGSLYLLAATGWRPFAFATPVGGVALLAGWLLLAVYALALEREA